MSDRIQLTSDGHSPYVKAVAEAFGGDIDYAMLIEEYATERQGYARYSPPICIAAHPERITATLTVNTSTRHSWNVRTSRCVCRCVDSPA